jgi:tetratricopeptide (TPR) repeat protein
MGQEPGEDHLPLGFELRFADGRAFVSAAGRPLGEGMVARQFAMEIPHVRFPFDVTGGAERFRDQRCALRELEVAIDAEQLQRWFLEHLADRSLGLSRLDLFPRAGFLEARGEQTVTGPFTAKIGLLAQGSRLLLHLYDLRLYRPGPLSAAELLHRLVAEPGRLGSPLIGASGPTGLLLDVLGAMLQRLLAGRGFKLPDVRGIELRRVSIGQGQVVLGYGTAQMPATPPLAEQLVVLDGERALAPIEALIAEGEQGKARHELLAQPAEGVHPLAAERILQLLACNQSERDLVFDLCALYRRRDPPLKAAMWVEGVVREADGDGAAAATAFLALAERAATDGEFFSAAAAARASAKLAESVSDDETATRAYSVWEGVAPQDVEALSGLADAAERRGDLAAALSALRRLAAYGDGDERAASAHARLGRLLLQKTDDVVRARLHLDQAVRLGAPDRSTVLALADACLRSGEPIRGIRLLDQAAELAERAGEILEAVGIRIRCGQVWEVDLRRPENALLRYREAADLARRTGLGNLELNAVALLATACERLGLWTEALEAQRLLSERSAPGRARAEAFLAQARILSSNLADAQGGDADRACSRALREDPQFLDAALELCRLRRGGPPIPLQEALQRAAALSTDPLARAALLSEEGSLALERLEDDDGARRAFLAALEIDPRCQPALSGLAGIAERGNRIGEAIGYLERLSALLPRDARSETFVRLATMAERIGDPAAAAQALGHAASEPDAGLPVLMRLLSVQRRRELWHESDALALRAADRADAEGDREAAVEILADQLRQPISSERAKAAAEMVSRLDRLSPKNASSPWVRLQLARLAKDGRALREALVGLLATESDVPLDAPHLPGRLQLWRELGEVSLALGLLSEAAAAYEEVCRLDARDEGAVAALVDLHGLLGNVGDEARCLEHLAALLRERGENALAAERFRQAAHLQRSRDPQASLSDLKLAASVAEAPPDVLAELAAAAEELEDFEQASQALFKLAPLLSTARERARSYRRSALLSTHAERSVTAARLAADADPSLPWAQLFRANLALQSGEASAARSLVEEALEATNGESGADALSEHERAVADGIAWAANRALGDVEGELRALEHLRIGDPENPILLGRRIELLRLHPAGEPELLRALREIAPRLSDAEASEVLAELGERLAARDEPVLADQAFVAALHRAPSNPRALIGALRLLPFEVESRGGLLAQLLTHPEALIQLDLEAAELGRLWSEYAGRLETEGSDARAAWRAATDADPADLEAPERWARALESAGHKGEAGHAQAELFRRLVRQGSADPWVAAARSAELLQAEGSPAALAEAHDVLGSAVDAQPGPNDVELVRLLRLLAGIQHQTGRSLDEARTLERIVARVAVNQRADLHARRAEIFRHLGEREGERSALEQAVAIRPRDLGLLRQLGEVQLTLGDFEGAVETLEQTALSLMPDRIAAAAAQVQRGRLAEEQLGHGSVAEAAYRKALALDPEQLDARRHLGELLVRRPGTDSVLAGLGLLAEALQRSSPHGAPAEALAALAQRAHAELGQDEFALTLLRPLLGEDGAPQEALVLGAELLYLGGATTESLSLLRRLSHRSFAEEPELAERLTVYHAEIAAQLGEVAEGLSELERLFQEGSQNRRLVSLYRELLRGLPAEQAAERLLAIASSLDESLAGGATSAAAELLLETQPQRALQLFAGLGDRVGLRAALVKVGDLTGLRAAIDQDLSRAQESVDAAAESDALKALAELYRAQGDADGEAKTLQRLVDLLTTTGPEEEEILGRSLLGELLERRGDSEGALAVYLEALPRPGASKLIAPSEILARRLGRWETLATLLGRKLQLASSPEVKAHRADWALELAALYQGPVGDLDLAERTLRQALDEDPDNLRVAEKLSEILEQAERWRELGELQLRRANQAEREGRIAHAGELYGHAGAHLLRAGGADARQEGLAALLQSLQFSRDPQRLLLAADALYESGDRVASADLYREVCERPAPPYRALERIADVERQRGDPRALGVFLASRAHEAESPVSWFLEASRAFARARVLPEQRRAARSAFDLDASNDAALAAVIATTAVDAVESWMEILDRRANSVPAEAMVLRSKEGELLLALGRPAEAVACFAQAVQSRPEDPLALAGWLDGLQAIHPEGSSEADEALQRLTAAVVASAVSDARMEAVLRLAQAELARGNVTQARWAFELAIQTSPLLRSSPGVLRSLDDIYGKLGLREAQLQVRIAQHRLAASADPGEAPALATLAMNRVLALLEPSDPEACETLQEAWRVTHARSAGLGVRLAEALASAERWGELVDWLHRLREESLSPPLAQAERVRLCLWAAEVYAERLLDRDNAAASRRLALEACGGEAPLLRQVEQVARQADPGLWIEVLGALAAQASDAERPALLLEKAKAADSVLSVSAAMAAWEEVLREGPRAPGYSLALERRLRVSLTEGRYSEAVESLLSEAEAAIEPHARASLLQKAAQLREERLGDADGAIELYRRAAAESADEKGFAMLAEAYDRLGRPAEAAAALAVEITRREPGERKRERQRKLGLLLAGELDSPREALPHLSAAQEGGADDPELLEALAECARATGEASIELAAISGLSNLGTEDPSHARELRRAELLRFMGRDAEAVDCLSRLLRVDPTHAAAFLELTELLERRKGWRELVGLLGERAGALARLEGGGDTAERAALLTRLGDISRVELDDLPAAEAAYRAAVALVPDHPKAREGLRAIFQGRGDDAATADLMQAEWDALPADRRSLAVGMRLGGLRTTLGDWKGARGVLAEVVALAEAAGDVTAATEAQRLHVRSLLALDEPREALSLLATAERGWSAELLPEVWALMGRAKLKLGHLDEAAELLRRALSMQPDQREALEGFRELSEEGPPAVRAEALSYQLLACDEPSEKAALWRTLADLQLGAMGDAAGAEESLRAAAAAAPDDERVFDRLREMLQTDGRIDDWVEVLRQRARGMNEEEGRARVLCELGDILRTRLRDPVAASEVYQRSLELSPLNPVGTEGLAESLLALGRDEEAAALYQRTLSGGGHLGEFFLHFRLGEIARRAGDQPQALEHFQHSVAQNPSFLPAGDALIAVAEEVGANEVALGALRARVTLLDPLEFADQVADAHIKIAELEKRALHFEAALDSLEQAAHLRPRDRRVLELLAAMYQNRSRWPEAVRSLEQLAEITDGPSRSSALVAAGEIALDKLGTMERAETLFESALQTAPDQDRAIRRLAEIAAAQERHEKLAAIADGYQAALGRQVPPWMEELWLPLATAYQNANRLEDAYVVIGRAREKSPDDATVLHLQADLARKLGRLGDQSDVEESLIVRLVDENPLEAASRLRALARNVLHQLDDAARAESLLQRANTLAPARPEDRRMLADLQRRHPEGRQEALGAYLDLVREDPTSDLVLLRVLAATAESVDRPELAQTARGLALALEGTSVGGAVGLTPFDASSWSLGSLAAASSLEIAMQSLAPYLEPLFPAQLHRFGVEDADRVGAGHAPDLHQWIERVRESLGARPIDVFLAEGTRGVAVENTQPPSLVIGAGAPEVLGQSGMQFLACQRLALIELGLILPAKFSPRDVTTLATLVTLFISDDLTFLPDERRRLAQFLDALAQTCPELIRAGIAVHAEGAARELARFDPQAYIRSGAERAQRIALLVTGDLHGGLRVFDYLDGAAAHTSGRPWDLPQGKALIAWAFSDEHLALRRAALGKSPLETLQ